MVTAAAGGAEPGASRQPSREWKGACARHANCVLSAGHRGKCKLGAVEEEDYEVEAIVAERRLPGGRVEFLLKWKGWPDDDNTWETEATLGGCPGVLRSWQRRQRERGPEAQAGSRTEAGDGPRAEVGNRFRAEVKDESTV